MTCSGVAVTSMVTTPAAGAGAAAPAAVSLLGRRAVLYADWIGLPKYGPNILLATPS